MGNFAFDSTEPASNSNPSVSQPIMLNNSIATEAILDVDHVGFDQDDGGTHKRMTIEPGSAFYPAPSASGTNGYVGYTDAGSASTKAYLFHQNEEGTFPGMAVRAFGVFTTNPSTGAVALANGYNVVSINSPSQGTYNVTLETSCVTGNNVVVTPYLSNSGTATWSFSNPTLTLTTNASGSLGNQFTFVVLQA